MKPDKDIDFEIIDQISVGLIGITSQRNIFLWNLWMEQYSGLKSNITLDKSLASIFPQAYSGRLLNAINTVFEHKMPSLLSNVFNHTVFPLYSFNQSLIQQSINVFPVNYKGETCCIIQVIDVSAAVAREQALECQVIERKKAELAKSEFLANMSHEIRTPLNGVLGMLELLKCDDLAPKTQEYINVAYSSANALLYIVNDVLDFSKIEAGKYDIELTSFNLLEFLEEIILSFAMAAQQKRVELNLDASKLKIMMVKGDPNRIKQVLMNVISNALKFTEVGQITVKVEILPIDHQNAQFICQVIDTGIGIKKQCQKALFSPFKQADTSIALKYGGTGLGLSIARQLCHLMGGDIEVKSEVGQGSCFTFDIMLNYKAVHIEKPILKNKQALIIGLSTLSASILSAYLTEAGCDVLITDSVLEISDFTQAEIEFLFISAEFYEKHFDLINLHIHHRGSKIKPIAVYPYFLKSKHIKSPYVLTQPILKSNLLDLIQDKPKPVKKSMSLTQGLQRHLYILVVEDNPINQIVIKEILTKLGYQFKLAKDGIEALDILQNPQNPIFDVILMDCKMPRLDGFETTLCIRQGKAGDKYKSIHIIALTANAIETEKQHCFDSGMDDFLSKPIDVEKLFQTLNTFESNKLKIT